MKNQNLNVTQSGAMAKLFASETCVKVANEAVQIHGGYGFTKDYPVEKFLRILNCVRLEREQVKFKKL